MKASSLLFAVLFVAVALRGGAFACRCMQPSIERELYSSQSNPALGIFWVFVLGKAAYVKLSFYYYSLNFSF